MAKPTRLLQTNAPRWLLVAEVRDGARALLDAIDEPASGACWHTLSERLAVNALALLDLADTFDDLTAGRAAAFFAKCRS